MPGGMPSSVTRRFSAVMSQDKASCELDVDAHDPPPSEARSVARRATPALALQRAAAVSRRRPAHSRSPFLDILSDIMFAIK